MRAQEKRNLGLVGRWERKAWDWIGTAMRTDEVLDHDIQAVLKRKAWYTKGERVQTTRFTRS